MSNLPWNNECPTCRMHCASRRSLRDDPNYDALIAAAEKYEEEEFEFREEWKNHNKLIQASIAKVVQRQSGALVKRGRDAGGAFLSRSQRNQRNVLSRGQNQVIDIEGSDDNEEENDNNEEDSSSAHEQSAEFRQRKRKRHTRVRPSQPSSLMYVARQTPLLVEKVEMLAVKGCSNTFCAKPVNENSSLMYDELTMLVIDPSKDELESLQEHETLAGLKSKCISKREHLILAYRQKE